MSALLPKADIAELEEHRCAGCASRSFQCSRFQRAGDRVAPCSRRRNVSLAGREERHRAQSGALRSIKGNGPVLALRRRCWKRRICSD